MEREEKVIDWARGATYACPRCNHDTVGVFSSWVVSTCCNCGSRFARFPRLQRFLRHVGVTCEVCTARHPVSVDGQTYGFVRRRHAGVGTDGSFLFESWLHDTDEVPDHRDRVRYVNTRDSRAGALADIAHQRSFRGRVEDDLSPVLAVVIDEDFYKYGADVTEEQQDGFMDGALEAYGIGVVRPYTAPHPKRGQFYADTSTFTWGLIAPSGLEGLFTRAERLPERLSAHAPQI